MIEPMRKKEPKKFLDASIVPVARALRERASQLEQGAIFVAKEIEHVANPVIKNAVEEIVVSAVKNDIMPGLEQLVKSLLAAELRQLADELHYW